MNVRTVTAEATTFTANAYLVTGEVVTLVDAGAMDGVVDTISETVDQVDRVVVTHSHSDHVDQLDAVLDAFEPDCYAYGTHPWQTHSLDDGDHIQVGDDKYEVVYTPGHADDHISLLGSKALFSGDVVVYNDGAFDDGSFGRTDYPGMSRDRLIGSIETLLDRLPDTVEYLYAGHGDVFQGDVRTVLERALERAQRREPKYDE
jgi:glyoxylase-like metal-dependent hydrolase (beta-lactamase superfamily II)